MKNAILGLWLLLPASLLGQEKTIVPGSNLVVDGIPPIPAELAQQVARYTDFRAASLFSWHPTRREMLIGTRFGDTAQVHRVLFPGGARTQLTFFADSVAGASYSPSKGDFFVFSRGTGGNERFQNFRFDFATGESTLLTDGQARNSAGIWDRSGQRMVYTSTRRNGADADLYVIQPTDPKSNRLLLEVKGGGWFPLDFSFDGRQLLFEEYVSINETYLWLLDLETGQKKEATPRKTTEKIAHSGGQFSKDGQAVFTASDQGSEFRRLIRLDLNNGKRTVLTGHIPWDVEEFRLAPDGKTLAVITNEEGIGTLHLFDADTGMELPRPKLPAGALSGLHWHQNSRELGFQIVSARSPSDVHSLDLSTGKVERWTFSETGGLNTDNFAEPELIHWKSFDDLKISGFLYHPPSRFTGKRPVIINIHGGPESQFVPTFLGRNNYYLNELGIALIFPNIRGSEGYGKTFLQLDNGFLRENAYKDIGALLDWIKTRPDLDPERILVTGGSYGGHMTLAVATYYPERIRCAVDVVGISNFVSFLENTESYRRDLRRVEYGDERDPKMRAFMEKIAPLNNAHKIRRPLFIIQGKNDPRVPLIEAEQMVATLKKLNTPVWYLMAEDEGHGFAKKKNADFQFYATVRFIQEHLLK